MKAMILTGIRQMEMREVPDLRITADTDVLLKMEKVGVCGSDVHYYNKGNIGTQVVQYPFTVGHECSAIAEQVGSAVTRVKPGDRIAVDPAISCGTCDQCRAGRSHTCRHLRFLGCPGQVEGCLSEYLIMPEQCCYPVGSEMTLDQAALSEPLTIGFYSVKRSIALKGAKIAVLGCGPIGLSVMVCARAMGPHAVYMTDKIPERLAIARSAGADWVGNPDKDDIVSSISGVEPQLLDAVFECCGEQEAIDQAVDLLKPGGKLMLIGIPQNERISFIIDRIRRKEICIQNIRRQCENLDSTLALMEQGLLNVDFMVTHRFGFDQTKEAFDLVADYRDGVVKAMIHFD